MRGSDVSVFLLSEYRRNGAQSEVKYHKKGTDSLKDFPEALCKAPESMLRPRSL